jgi:hypothetical protein
MAPRLAEHGLHELAGAVGHLGLAIEAVVRLHEHAEAHHPRHLAEVAAKLVGDHREGVQGALLGGGLRVLDRHLGWHRTGLQEDAVRHRKLTRHEDEVSRADRRHVRRHRLRGGGKGQTKLGEGGVWVRHGGAPSEAYGVGGTLQSTENVARDLTGHGWTRPLP